MKISVSMSEGDLAALDALVEQTGLASRSAAVQRALRALAAADLEDDYMAAYMEWETSGHAGVWAATSDDGLRDAPR